MKKMKKMLALLISVLMILALTACSGGVSASLIFGFIAALCTKSKSQS